MRWWSAGDKSPGRKWEVSAGTQTFSPYRKGLAFRGFPAAKCRPVLMLLWCVCLARFAKLWAAAGFLVDSFHRLVAQGSLGRVQLPLSSTWGANHTLPPRASSLEPLGNSAPLPGVSCHGFSKGSSLPLPVHRGFVGEEAVPPAGSLQTSSRLVGIIFLDFFFCIYILKERLEYHKASQLEGPFQFIQCTVFVRYRLALRNAAR